MRFKKGDIVLIGNGKVHWEVIIDPNEFKLGYRYLLESGLTGRRRLAWEKDLKPWVPGD